MGYIAVYKDVTFCPVTQAELKLDGQYLSLSAVGDAERASPPIELRFSALRERLEADGFDRWAFEIRHGQLLTPVSLHARTAPERLHAATYVAQAGINLFAHVIVRPEDRDFEDCVILINGPPELEFSCNKPFVSPGRRITLGRKFYWPEMTLSGAGRTSRSCTIQVRMHERANCDLYPKSDVGHVPRKIRVTNGRGTFVFSPLGMRKGQSAEIKVGFANFSNVASHTIVKQ
jgi:hypothetical protein